MFNAKEVKNNLVQWIKDWFEENGPGCNCVCGISSGKDSTIVAALCVEALGKDRVIGVMMPNGVQHDINDSYKVIDHLGIRGIEVNIRDTYDAMLNGIFGGTYEAREDFPQFNISDQTRINLR